MTGLILNPYRFAAAGGGGGTPALLTGMTGSGSRANYASYVPANMVDNNDATYYMMDGPAAAGDWAKVDIGSTKTVTAIEVKQGFSSTSDGNAIKFWDLQYSTDGASWTTISSGTAQVVSASGLTVSARYVRLYSTGSSGSAWPTFMEFRVWGY